MELYNSAKSNNYKEVEKKKKKTEKRHFHVSNMFN